MRTVALLALWSFTACGGLPEQRVLANAECGKTACGCAHPADITLTGRTIDSSSRAGVSGVNVLCDGEAEPIGASDSNGYFRAELQALRSPGCGLSRCDVIRFSDPAGRFRDALYAETELGGNIALSRR